MKSTPVVQNSLSSLGIDKRDSLNNPLKKNHKTTERFPSHGQLNSSPPLSPKEIWIKKEKALKLKGLILLLLTHMFWILLYTTQETDSPISRPQATVEKEHELIKLPARIYSQLPREGEKIAVTIFIDRGKKPIPALLRGWEEDPLGESGTKAILEVPKTELNTIKNYDQTWLVFPPMQIKTTQKRSIYEINF
ncbi:MAG: hypothetical protein CME60_03225 [Halobacteriovoraceae bacterium]|nr:hypothetical protein [Halobacteriovoraceae bacterium]|tara:strand:- start:49727 stop:50305 length:579 start_codon:yes stop_codon:yes gene_type:complete